MYSVWVSWHDMFCIFLDAEAPCHVIFFPRHFTDDTGLMHFSVFSLCRWHGSLRFLGMSDDSHVICRYYKFPQLLSWACEWILKPDILSSAGTVLTCILYPKRCKHKLNPVQPCPHQSNAKSTEHVDMTEHAKSLCFYINAVLWHEICASRTPVFRERKKLCFTWL